jgi:prolyl-tRNA editing enzyme YbaK/EbsC (Cys-tRNA(Pro) deacylase)
VGDRVRATDELHPSARKVAEYLKAAGAKGPFLEFEESTKTAADAAAALSCDVGAIASCLVFVLDDDPVVIVKSGAFRVDTDRFAALVGGSSMRRASPDEVREATGQPIGGVSPVNWPGELRVFIDDSLKAYDVIWSACGTPNAVFATSYEELTALTNAQPVSLLV